MALAIDAKRGAVSIQHDQRIVIGGAVFLVDRHRDYNAEFLCNFSQLNNSRMGSPWQGAGEMRLFLRLAEIVAAEKFRRQDDIRAVGCSLLNKAGHTVDIRLSIVTR